MAELSLSVAQRLAAALVTIGHPYQQQAIDATALDLMKWCKGAFVAGCAYSPEKQAETLVEAARTTWEAWPERGGTRQLLALFRTLFGKREEPWSEEKAASEEARMLAAAFSRGHLAPPCEHCEPGDPYCEWGGPRLHAREKARALELARHATPPAAPVTELSLDQLRAKAQALYEDEIRRKREQLGRLGVD